MRPCPAQCLLERALQHLEFALPSDERSAGAAVKACGSAGAEGGADAFRRSAPRDRGNTRHGSMPGAVNVHRPGDVLDGALAHILEGKVELVADLVAHDAGDADPPGLGQEPRGARRH